MSQAAPSNQAAAPNQAAQSKSAGPPCRFCGAPLTVTFCDLGVTPLSNAYVTPDRLSDAERFYPLHARVCDACLLVQVEAYESPQSIFGDYAYFSSYSESWLEHARRYAEDMWVRLGLGAHSRVIELASNDGYLLQYFKAMGIPVLGIEPAANVAAAAEKAGIPTRVEFFGTALARRLVEEGTRADLLLGNNVLAHVPDLNDFVAGMKVVLAERGTITMEFPHLLRLIENNQFDTIYHEHFSYFSLLTVMQVFARHGLRIFDVEELATHGGSLRIYATHADAAGAASQAGRAAPRGEAAPALGTQDARLSSRPSLEGSEHLERVLRAERDAGLDRLETYRRFGEQVRETKRALLDFLIGAKRAGKTIAAYGAAAKGNTLLNYCGVRSDFIDYVVDRNPHKQGRYLPGTRIPIHAPERIFETHPDYLLILPWNLRDEIVHQMEGIRRWGGRFVVPIPRVEVL